MKLRTSEWGPIYIPIGLVANVAGMLHATHPYSWQNRVGTFSLLSQIPSFLLDLPSTWCSPNLIGPLNRLSFLIQGSSALWELSLAKLGHLPGSRCWSRCPIRVWAMGMISTPFNAVSLACGCALVVFLAGFGLAFLAIQPVLHSVAWCPSWPHLKQAVDQTYEAWGFVASLFSRGDLSHALAAWYLFQA